MMDAFGVLARQLASRHNPQRIKRKNRSITSTYSYARSHCLRALLPPGAPLETKNDLATKRSRIAKTGVPSGKTYHRLHFSTWACTHSSVKNEHILRSRICVCYFSDSAELDGGSDDWE